MVDLSYLKRNVFPGESGGDYNALFGYSQRPGRQFAGVNLTDMTVDQALQFADPSGPYGQWVKGQVGRVATPMGAYQVVGSTLRAAKEGLGLTGNERMTPELQDQIGQWIYQTQGPGAWEAWGKGGSTGDTGMVRGGAGQTSMTGQAGADFLASEQERPRGLLGGFFGPEGRDRRARLAIALEGMTLNPNQALIGELQRGMERRETAAQRNATVEFLRSRGRDDLADAIQGGLPAADALRIAMTPAEAQKGVVMGDRLVDPRTGQVIADFSGQAPAFKPEDISAARKEFTGLAPVKSFAEQTAAYGRIIASVEDPSPAGDLALIFNYMKVLDPGSTVREGEFATAEQAGGVDQRVRGLYNRVVSGERLTPEQRADFASRATRLYENAEQQYRSLADQYASFARAAGLPVEQVIPDFGYSGSLYQTPLEFQVPPPPAGIDPTQWRQAWQNMTDDERRQFLQGQP